MKGRIRKLKHYPVTLLEAVYKNGTNKDLATILSEYDTKFTEYDEKIENVSSSTITVATTENVKYSDVLKNYKGTFDFEQRQTLRGGEVGDYWFYDGEERLNLDGNVIYPNSYIYIDMVKMGGTEYKAFKSIKILKDITFKPKQQYDVVIVGGGAGGIGTAYALKDSDLKVALIERFDTLGGTHCNGVGLMIANPVGNWYKDICKQAYDDGSLDFRSGDTVSYYEVGDGITFEKRWRASLFSDPKNVVNNYQGRHLNIDDVYFSKKYYDDLSPTIDIFTNHEVVKVHAESEKVYQVECLNRATGATISIVGDYFVDCSADAVLFTKNEDLTWGTDYYSGTDGRARFGETVYGESEEPNVYGINSVEPIFYKITNPYDGSGYVMPDKPEWLKPYTDTMYISNFTHTPPKNNGIAMVSYSYGLGMSNERLLTREYEWNFADGYSRAEYQEMNGYNNNGVRQFRFAGICKLLAIRESYRVACEKTVDQNYLLTKITSDNIESEKIMALSTWYVDIHNQSYSCTSNICNGIPYEAMIPKCYTNVLVASRCYGASHIGLSSLRLSKTMLDLGYSAGKSMIQAVQGQIDVRDVDTAQVQTDTGILETMQEVETYFYGDTVDYTEVTE